MHDFFDATNLLSGEKHSDYGNPFDKRYFYKEEYEKIEKKQQKLASAELEQKHDKLWTQAANGKLSDSNIDFKDKDKEHVTKSNIMKEKVKYTIKQNDNERAKSKVNGKVTISLAKLKTNVHEGIISMKPFTSRTTTKASIENKSKPLHSGYANDGRGIAVNAAQINTSFDLSSDDTIIMYENAPKGKMNPGYSRNGESGVVISREDTTKGAPPYITVLTSSVAVLGIVMVVLIIIMLYKRRHKSTNPVISDEMYNAYKLSRTMAARSPLPSPRVSEQERFQEYDFVVAESSSTQFTWETTTVSQEQEESVYLELDDDSGYDYATAPVTPD